MTCLRSALQVLSQLLPPPAPTAVSVPAPEPPLPNVPVLPAPPEPLPSPLEVVDPKGVFLLAEHAAAAATPNTTSAPSRKAAPTQRVYHCPGCRGDATTTLPTPPQLTAQPRGSR